MPRKPLSLLLTLLIAVLLIAQPLSVARAATINVDTTDDEYNTDPAECSLREAIQAANTDAAFGGCDAGSGDDTISLPAGIYTFTL
ncbi:MAG: CSLREA domain-containing protein [Anaerolineales bacterium]|nr:CSLREA domain-containing protein [Anaerolineales bacterium]